MQVLEEKRIVEHPEDLAIAWGAEQSFVLLPSPLPVEQDWIGQVLGSLPAEFAKGHFGILTSGSTGTPKLVFGEKARAESLAAEIHRRQQLDIVKETIRALPLAYSYCLVNQWVWSHCMERPLRHTPGLSDPSRLIAALAQAESAMLCLVGSQVPLLRRYVAPGTSFPGVVRLNFAGGPFPQNELPWLSECFPDATLFHNYGCTEALPRLTIREAGECTDAMILGRPLDGISLRLNEQGELHFRSPYSAVAYADQTGCRLFSSEDWLATGDLAEALDEGRFRLVGRQSEVFKRHGEKISLAAIESVLRESWPGAVAFFRETARDSEPGYVAVFSPSPDPITLRKLLVALRDRFRRPHWPIRVEAADHLPLSANGKVDLAKLREIPKQILWKQML